MKPVSPHDPFDDLIAVALYGDLTPEERTQFDARLASDPAARAAYQEAKSMHDLLEKTHNNAQPDPDFEHRMVSGVRRKIQQEEHRETAWESLLVLWNSVKGFVPKNRVARYATIVAMACVVGASVILGPGGHVARVFSTVAGPLSTGKSSPFYLGEGKAEMREAKDLKKVVDDQGINYTATAQNGLTRSGYVETQYREQFAGASVSVPLRGTNTYTGGVTTVNGAVMASDKDGASNGSAATTTPSGRAVLAQTLMLPPADESRARADQQVAAASTPSTPPPTAKPAQLASVGDQIAMPDKTKSANVDSLDKAQSVTQSEIGGLPVPRTASAPASTSTPVAASTLVDNRKLIRNAQLDLEVKSFQGSVDEITALTKAAGGYVDTSNSQKGGNGKLQGTVVVKVLPQNLDSFLGKLRNVGQIENQSVSTDDVTKDYIDTQARLDNARRMETQLQELLKRDNGKVSDLLQVERELGRVRGNIEQMQGQLKLYDFQVQYATVTMQVKEKDLNQAAAYLLKEQDDFSLFSTDVEGTFQKARKTADDFKAQVLVANLNHNSGNNVSADLTVMVAPEQIDAFLTQVRAMGRVDNFTRQTQRVAKDGGDSDNPADETKTDRDKVQVHLAIRSDDDSRKQVALTVVTATVDDALEHAKLTAMSNGAEILSSSLNRAPQGQATANLSIRVPGKNYQFLLDAFRALGRPASFSIQREDNSGYGGNSDEAPVIVTLALTDNDTPIQETEMVVRTTDVDSQAQQLKKDAAAAGVQVASSNFQRQADGMEYALLTFRLPMGKYPAFLESLKKVGQVETLTVQRQDRPDQTRADDSAPVEISLRLHNQRDIVAPNNGLWATLRQTFSEGASALFTSVKTIGVLIAFVAPWLVAGVVLAWIGRRIYVWKKK